MGGLDAIGTHNIVSCKNISSIWKRAGRGSILRLEKDSLIEAGADAGTTENGLLFQLAYRTLHNRHSINEKDSW